MNQRAPFTADDLQEMDDSLFSRATAVVAMEDVHDGNRDPRCIALRHDVDGTHHATREALQTAVEMAEWEAERQMRSSYYFLHTAPYWSAPGFRESVDRIAECGHEIGIHNNAIAEALRTGDDPDLILEDAIETLRGFGYPVRGAVGHGDPFCNRDAAPGESWVANDEQWKSCPRPDYGKPNRVVTRGNISLKLRPRALAEFGLEYEALWLGQPFPFRISDSGGRWVNPGWEETVEKWNHERAQFPDVTEATSDVRQLAVNVHPDWWSVALPAKERRAA